MKQEAILFLTVAIPILGSFFLPLAGKVSHRLRNLFSFLLVITSLLGAIKLLPAVLAGNTVLLGTHFPGGINFTLMADGLAVFMAMVSSLISAIIVFYSFDYISHYEHSNEYYAMVVLFLGSMMGIVFAGNLLVLFLCWELTAISSWRLIGFFRKKTDMLKADKAFLVTVFGALVMLVGFIMVYMQTGSFEYTDIRTVLSTQPLSNIAVVLILFGILSKSATLPFHTWLPDAGVAPSPVTALLHAAVLVKIGVYVYARLFLATMPLDGVWTTVIPIIAGASALISAGAAFLETDIKRIIAYSTISQIGFIFFGLSTGNPIGIVGGLLYILMHGLAKAGLFLCAGIIEQNTKVKDITKLGGLIQTMPLTAGAFLVCAFSVMGVPPLGGFFSKYLVFMGSVNTGSLLFSLVFFIGALMTIVYLFRLFSFVFLGEAKVVAYEESPSMIIAVILCALLSLGAGILIYYPNALVQAIVRQLPGVTQ